jgi:RNA polymerase sigma factor for flagellar operon FliA
VRLNGARRDLAGRYIGLAIALCRPYKKVWPESRDEFESAATMALVVAAGTYDPRLGVPFAMFARQRILGSLQDVQRGLVLKGWRGGGSHRHALPRVEPLPGSAHEEDRRLSRHIKLPGDHPCEVADELDHWFRVLPRPYARVCRVLYLEGRSMTQVARELGVTQPRVSEIHARSLDRLAGSPKAAAYREEAALRERVRSRPGRRRLPNGPSC